MIPWEAALPAAGAGLMIGLAVRAAVPPKPDLGSVLQQLDGRRSSAAAADTTAGTGTNSLPERVGARLLGEFGSRITLPEQDLKLLRRSPAELLGRRVLFSLAGFVVPQLFQGLLALAGTPFPFQFPLLFSLFMGVLLWFTPVRDLKIEAAEARRVIRHAVASYLERVALARIANSGAAQALTRTAEVGDGWVFHRLRQVFDQAELSGTTAWEALRQLGEELDIPELKQPADTLELAREGATVFNTLTASADQLREALRADAKSEANEAGAVMYMPIATGVILMMIFVMLPAINNIMSA